LRRLNEQSVTKHFEAYVDIDWDSDELRLDPEDPRWELPTDEPLASTAWYQSLPAATRARLGCNYSAYRMKAGLEFESILKRGLLEYASRLPNGSPEFRYAYHEVIEEAQHALMFQEFVNRSGFEVRGLSRIDRLGARIVLSFAAGSPSSSSSSSSAAKTPSITCNASIFVEATAIPSTSGSCASTSPRKLATSPSPATTSSDAPRSYRAGDAPLSRSVRPSCSQPWPRSC
jgi:hypothetical protein